MKRSQVVNINYIKLIFVSGFVSLMACMLAFTLKHITEYVEHFFFDRISGLNALLFILMPSVGITIIYFLRKYLFLNKKNKGITEIYKTLDRRKDHLPFYKIPSHYLNGFLTVVFGGSTGIEVSTVVATATIGNQAYELEYSARNFKRELVCAGVSAGVAVLFASPLAGWLFAMEVIARKRRKTLYVSCTAASIVAALFIYAFDHSHILPFHTEGWHWYALPFFVLLSLLGGLLSVYFTTMVIRIKQLFHRISNNFLRVNTGAVLVGSMIFCFPVLYGDSYAGLKEVISQISGQQISGMLMILMLIFLKPLAASLTLGAGGDGGVFAPSIVAGAFLGLLLAQLCNQFWDMGLIPLNFALVGAAATLSAAIYAPCTALILTCNLIPNGYELFFPILVGVFLSKIFARRLLPYNVYTYDFYLAHKGEQGP